MSSDSTPVKINKPSGNTVTSISTELFESLMNDFTRDWNKKLDGCLNDIKGMIGSGETKHEELRKIVSQQSNIIERQQNLIDSLRADLLSTQRRLQTAEEKIDELEQYSRRNTIEVHGIPETHNEEIMDTVKEVGKSFGFNISPDMIDACHRLKPFRERTGMKPTPSSILVKFVRRRDADLMMELRKKQGMIRRHMIRGLDGQDPVFINRSLTAERRKLLGLARQLKRDGKINDAWVDHVCKIRIRKEVDGRTLVIRNAEDLKFPSL